MHARRSGHPNDISSPDFSDWMVHLSESISWTGVSVESPKNKIEFEDEADELRKEGLLCCPEDYICTQGCHNDKKLCLKCQIPMCKDCRLCMRNNKKSPVASTNDNWVGYAQNWIYEQEVTWMEKTVSSPHRTGLTVFTIGAKGQERRKTKQHLMHDKMFSAKVIIKQIPTHNKTKQDQR